MLLQILKSFTGFEFVKELKFDDKRKWRFDYANEDTKTAVEIEGGAFTNGRHTRGKGFVNDMEKYNRAIELGWTILRYTPDQIKTLSALNQIKNVCENRKI